MTAQTFNGFLLTRNWRDTRDGVELEYWFSTGQGPLCVLVRGERSVFFLAEQELERARVLLGTESGIEIKPVQLRNFALLPVVPAGKLPWRQYRRGLKISSHTCTIEVIV